MTKEQAQWLLGDYAQVRQLGRVSKWIDDHIKAMSIIKGKNINKPSCNCEYAAYASMASSMYEQHLDYIKQVANTDDERETRVLQGTEEGRTGGSQVSTGAKSKTKTTRGKV